MNAGVDSSSIVNPRRLLFAKSLASERLGSQSASITIALNMAVCFSEYGRDRSSLAWLESRFRDVVAVPRFSVMKCLSSRPMFS